MLVPALLLVLASRHSSCRSRRCRCRAAPAQLEATHARDTAAARALAAAGQRERALLALRARTATTALLTRTHGWLFNVDSLLLNIDAAARVADVTASLKAGAVVLKALADAAPLAEVEQLLGAEADAVRYRDALAAAVGGAEAEDEAAEDELRELERMAADEEAAALPAAPATRPAVATPQPVAQPRRAAEESGAAEDALRGAARGAAGGVLRVAEPLPA